MSRWLQVCDGCEGWRGGCLRRGRKRVGQRQQGWTTHGLTPLDCLSVCLSVCLFVCLSVCLLRLIHVLVQQAVVLCSCRHFIVCI